MAYNFPLGVAEFLSILPIRDMVFDIPEAIEMSETEGGEILTAEIGARLWQGEIALDDMTPDEAAEAKAMLDVLRRPGATFLCHDVGRPGPRRDLTGRLLGAAGVTLSSVSADNREIRLAGLPQGYQISRYDYLSFRYGADPTRFALHRAAAPGAANAAGQTSWIEVTPNIRPGWAAGAAVSLKRAACKAIIVPGSVNPGRRKALMTTGCSFKFIQTLR